MAAAVISLVGCIVAALSLIAWHAYQLNAARKAVSAEREAHSATRLDLERERLQHDVSKQRLAQTDRTIAALNEALDDAEATASDLNPSDVISRVRRAAAKAHRDGALRDAAGPEMPGAETTERAGTALMPIDG